jgi:hypothetical protein
VPDIRLRDNGPALGDITLSDVIIWPKQIKREGTFDASVLSGKAIRRNGMPSSVPLPENFNDIARSVLESPPDPQVLAGRVVRRNGFTYVAVPENFNDISRSVIETLPDKEVFSGRVIRREGVSHGIHILSISDVIVMSDTPTGTIVSKGNTIFYGTNN